jgi:hypothetical protein
MAQISFTQISKAQMCGVLMWGFTCLGEMANTDFFFNIKNAPLLTVE